MNIARNGRVAMVAIPRDTVQVPLASGGHSGSRRVNTLYIGYKRRGGAHGVDCNALNRVRLDIAKALGTQIPYYAMIRMDEFQELISQRGRHPDAHRRTRSSTTTTGGRAATSMSPGRRAT